MLDLKNLVKRCQNGEQFEYLLFWGHTPSRDGKVTKACFSQWYVAPFTVEGNKCGKIGTSTVSARWVQF
jgi:predicted NAD-dependent protein-ADP-ribosyltransferase YbiA (DUF1768 family)